MYATYGSPSLVNILADERVVPEFMPFVRDTRPVAQVAHQLLTDADWRAVMVRRIDRVVAPLAAGGVSERVLRIAASLMA